MFYIHFFWEGYTNATGYMWKTEDYIQELLSTFTRWVESNSGF